MSDPDSQRPVRLGLLGTGLAARKLHWPALRRLSERYAVTACHDRSPEAMAEFADLAGVARDRLLPDREALLAREDVDAVLITLPIPELLPATADALAAGKDVICEKPAGGDEEQARAFVELVRRHPERRVLLAENMFYRDDLRLARQLVDAGALGRVHLVVWRFASHWVPRPGEFSSTPWRHRPAYRGGALLDNGVHHMARLRLICGEVRSFSALVQRANVTIDAPSDLALDLEFQSGAIGSYAATHTDIPLPPETNETRVYGTSGTLVIAEQGPRKVVQLYRADEPEQTHLFEGVDNGHWGELTNFADAVQHGAPIVGTVEQSARNLLLVVRGLDAAERREVTTPDAPWLE
ncbi:MAG: Gfo/Idh/MocA family oxidoreductase, partial [Candidatus Dormibacteraeota bacterium]|nr:Gfo/Idh/MocA family oxidoreductase [Candidatus Dormibacteraeota bacterium]